MGIRLLLFTVIFLAAILRLWRLDSYPAGFTPDEASFGYDAYSILKTGKDQWGNSFPLTLRSFGDFKAPLYTYLTIPSIAIFGLTEFAVRLPNAILGVLAVLVVYLLTKELFAAQRLEIGNPPAGRAGWKLEILAATLLAVSPWHISLSRGAFEANLTTFLMPLGILAFLKGLRAGPPAGGWMLVSAVVFGLNLFSYHSARFITPILLTTLILWKWNYAKSLVLHSTGVLSKIALVLFAIFLSFSILSIIGGAGSRGADIGIFNPTGGWGAVADRRYEAVQAGLPDSIARIFSNKATYVAGEFVKNYLSYLSPTFLFTQGAGEATYGMIPGHGVLYLFELPFIVAALWMVIKRPIPGMGLLIVWILLSPIPAALTKGPGFAANRAAVMMPAIQILSAYGGVMLFRWLKENFKFQISNFKLVSIGYWAIGLFGVLFFLEAYIYHAPRLNAPSMSYGWRQTMDYIRSIESQVNEIVVSRAFSEPHIFVAFYTKWDPVDYQKQAQDFLRYEKQELLFVDQLGEYRLGKYTFRDIHYQEDIRLQNVLLAGRIRDFPENVTSKKTILFPDGKKAMLFIDPLPTDE